MIASVKSAPPSFVGLSQFRRTTHVSARARAAHFTRNSQECQVSVNLMGWPRQTQKPQVPEGSAAFLQQGWIAHFNELPSEAWGEHFSLGGRSPTPKGDGWAVELLTADPSTNYPALREPPNAGHSAATASPFEKSFEKFVENADPNLMDYLLRLVEAEVRTFFPE